MKRDERPRGGALSMRRRILGFVVALAGGPLLSWLLFSVSRDDTITADVLAYQLLVVVVALIGGIWPAVAAAVLSGLMLDFLLVAPLFDVAIADPSHVVALALYIVTAILVSWAVDRAARRARAAERAAAVNEAAALAETDRVRSALLSAVSHDLRRPLAAAVAAIGGLRAAGPALSEADRRELVETADESLATLSRLVTDLLDVSRVQAGVLGVSLAPVDAAGVVLAALDELSLGPDDVELALDPALPPVRADAVLLQRVLVNLLANAERHSPAGARAIVSTSLVGDRAVLRVADHGPGVPRERQGEMFAPFQRMGDTDNTVGLGLGLALSMGFTEGMGGTLTPEDTPGGGLTMIVALPVAAASVLPSGGEREAAP